MQQKYETFLLQRGWKEVFGFWQSPLSVPGAPYYFLLDEAYELETTGEGIHAYAGQQCVYEALKASDVDRMNQQEEERFARTGIRRGVPPNY